MPELSNYVCAARDSGEWSFRYFPSIRGWRVERLKTPISSASGTVFWYGSTPYGDDPNDQYWIRAGIDYAKRTGF